MRRTTRGMDTVDFIANLAGTQAAVELVTEGIARDANSLLMDHHVENIAHIELASHDVDRWVVLQDSNVTNDETGKDNSALSIETGRAGYIDPVTGEKWGEMEGLNILAQAAGVKRRRMSFKRRKRRKPQRVNGRWIN